MRTWSPRMPRRRTRTASCGWNCRYARGARAAAASRSRPGSSRGAPQRGHPRAPRIRGRRAQHRGGRGGGHRGGHPRASGKASPGRAPGAPAAETVPFPDTLTPLAVGRPRSMRLVNEVLSGERMLALVASKDPEAEEPGPDKLYDVGVAGVVARMLKVPDGSIRILVQGIERVRLADFVAEEPYLIARIEALPDVVEASPELDALTHN